MWDHSDIFRRPRKFRAVSDVSAQIPDRHPGFMPGVGVKIQG